MFRRVLVANRGEIALRVIRTLEEMGIETVAVASDPDLDAPHALAADHVHRLGPAAASASYLRKDLLIEAATRSGAEAIHPGYGFLSENADFALACREAGIAFIGPSPEAMRIMGSKTASRRAMEKAGVPVVPGTQEDTADDRALARAAESLGYPVLVKAAAGGGGKGMRLVASAAELPAALRVARGEAESYFGDGRVYVEKYLTRPRHVEIQILGDAEGHVWALGERECSVQRRHQKILEESPSPAVDPALRKQMEATAVRAAETVGYRNAGTVEFLLAGDGAFYFLEMNTRLQVEHAVTETVYGVDLVAAQVRIAAGEPLPFDPRHLTPRGHAIEARVYAEDPAHEHLPQTGTVLRLRLPARPGLRIDSGLAEGREVTVHYDPLLCKMVAWGETRAAATARLRAALRDTVLLGVTTNLDFLADVLDHPAWKEGRLHTGFVAEHFPSWPGEREIPDGAVAVAAEAWATPAGAAPGSGGAGAPPGPWTQLGSWTPAGER